MSTPLVCDGDDWEDFAPGVTDLELIASNVGDRTLVARVGGSGNTASIAQPDANAHYITALFRGGEATDAERLRVWIDGVEQTGGAISHSGTIPAAVPAISAGKLGARTNGAVPYSGKMSVAAVYAADLEAQFDQMHAAVRRIAGIAA